MSEALAVLAWQRVARRRLWVEKTFPLALRDAIDAALDDVSGLLSSAAGPKAIKQGRLRLSILRQVKGA